MIKGGLVVGALLGAGIWTVFRIAEEIFNIASSISQYPLQTFTILVFVFIVIVGVITSK